MILALLIFTFLFIAITIRGFLYEFLPDTEVKEVVEQISFTKPEFEYLGNGLHKEEFISATEEKLKEAYQTILKTNFGTINGKNKEQESQARRVSSSTSKTSKKRSKKKRSKNKTTRKRIKV